MKAKAVVILGSSKTTEPLMEYLDLCSQTTKALVQNGYNIPRWGEYRNVWNLIREVGESALGIFMSGDKSIYQEGDKIMETLFSSIDYDQVSSCGIIFHIAAYWESQKAEVDL